MKPAIDYTKGNATRPPAWLALTKAQQRLSDAESDWFSGQAAAVDRVRAALVELRSAERAVLEGRP